MPSLQAKTYLVSLVAAIVTIGALVYGALFTIPALRSIRTQIDNDRAAEAVIVQQQSNLKVLSQNLEEINDQQAALDAEVWSFATEDAFFTWFDGLVSAHHLSADDMTLADAVPGSAIVNRALSVKLRGTGADLLGAITDIQARHPLVAITHVALTPGEAATISLELQATTLWR